MLRMTQSAHLRRPADQLRHSSQVVCRPMTRKNTAIEPAAELDQAAALGYDDGREEAAIKLMMVVIMAVPRFEQTGLRPSCFRTASRSGENVSMGRGGGCRGVDGGQGEEHWREGRAKGGARPFERPHAFFAVGETAAFNGFSENM